MMRAPDPESWSSAVRPLARRPLVVIALGTIAVVLLAIGAARAGGEPYKPDVPSERAELSPAHREAQDLIDGFKDPVDEPALYEEPLAGPELQQNPWFEELPAQAPPLDHSPAEEQLVRALSAPTGVEFAPLGSSSRTGEAELTGEEPPAPFASIQRPALRLPGADQDLGALFSGKDPDPRRYKRKAEFLRAAAEASPTHALPSGPEAARSPFEVKAGTVIPAILVTGINSELPGQILAQVAEAVYDTVTGRTLLIPQGAKVVGSYDNQVAFAEKRVLIVWDRIIFPNGDSLDLQGMAGVDPSGYAGFRDQVKRHVGRRVGAALLLSVFNVSYELSRSRSQGPYSAESAVSSAVGQSLAELGREMIEREMDVPPTIKIRPGYRFAVMVNKDIPFLGPYVP